MHTDNRKTIAIVDGYSIGKLYAPEFKKRGYDCINIQSATEVPEIYKSSFFRENYIDNLIYTGKNLQDILNTLRDYHVSFVIAGSEPGVELADLLGHEMHFSTTNLIELSEARRNKFKMIEALKTKGLKTVEHVKSSDVEDILLWAKKLNTWPIVLKELKGAGGEGVSFCYNQADIVSGFETIRRSQDVYGNKNDEVLAESYLDGDQYLVNMVSLNGQHKLTDLWVCKKTIVNRANVILDYLKLLPCDYKFTESLVLYTYDVLNALGIKYGPSHNEVMLTKTGPVLIESGSRLMGAVDPTIIARAIGHSQLDATIESYLHPASFIKKIDIPYRLKKHLMYKFVLSGKSGIIRKINFIENIEKLQSFERMDLKVKLGSALGKTKDLWTSPGSIYLSHEDEGIVDADYQKTLLYEREMFQV